MEWPIILALVIGIPIVLFPVAYVWYLNIAGIYLAFQEARKRRAIRKQKVEVAVPEPATTSKPRIREVQVFHRAGEKGLTEAIGREASLTEEGKEKEKARVRQPKIK